LSIESPYQQGGVLTDAAPSSGKNILVYRALEMALFLFYAEDASRHLIDLGRHLIPKKAARELKGGKLLRAIFDSLVSEGSISRAESEELQGLLEHRNTIAHEIHLLTGDIDVPGGGYQFRGLSRVKYDYTALTKVRKWHKAVYDRIPMRNSRKPGQDFTPCRANVSRHAGPGRSGTW
jgi:hypothetical protein